MSQRERPAPHGPAVHPAASAGNGGPVAWNDLYDRLPHDQRTRLMNAAENGAVPADQVPPPPTAPPPLLLQSLIAGNGVADLPPLGESNVVNLPADLDAGQRAAVALALRTPDVALVQGQSGSGTTRIAAIAALRAAVRGERILLVAPNSAAVDRILAQLADYPEVCSLRCVDRDEQESSLPPFAAGCTFAAHTHRLTEQAREHAESRVAAAREGCRRRDAEAAVYDHLLELAEQRHRLEVRRDLLTTHHSRLITHDSAPSNGAADPDLATRRLEAELARSAVAEIERPLAVLRPLAAARAAGRWWTPAWWRARSAGNVTVQLAELEAKYRQAETYAVAIEREVERIVGERSGRREIELHDQIVALDRELNLVADKWQQALRQLPATGPRPKECTPDSAAAAQDAWGRDRDVARQNLESAHSWLDGLEPLLEALPGRCLEAVNLVAATPAALAADPHFGDGRRGLFDLLIAIDADALADAELLATARRTRRWMLIGDGSETRNTKHETRDTTKAEGNLRNPHANPVSRVSCLVSGFARLWSHLHCDPWVREGDRVVCRLRSVPPDRRDRLDREPIADRPDIELRIHTPTGGDPELAEVAFPAGTSVAQAVDYLCKELGELPPALGPGRTIQLESAETMP